MTGAAVLQPGVLNDPSANPNTLQDEAGGIYNQGARAAYHQKLVGSGKAVLIDANNSLENLSVRYWLYPAELVGSRYGTDIGLALQHPEQRTVIYVGPRENYIRALATMDPKLQTAIIASAGDDVFAVARQL